MTKREKDELLKAIKKLTEEIEELKNRPLGHGCCGLHCCLHTHYSYPISIGGSGGTAGTVPNSYPGMGLTFTTIDSTNATWEVGGNVSFT